MAEQHTPGPWKTLRFDECQTMVMGGKAPSHLATVVTSDEEDKANARLIAAAPDLLEALQDAKDLLRRIGPGWGDCEEVFATANAAIAKATGGA